MKKTTKKLVTIGFLVVVFGVVCSLILPQTILFKSKKDICDEWAMKGMNFTSEQKELFLSFPKEDQARFSALVVNTKRNECLKKSREKLPWNDNETNKIELAKWTKEFSISEHMKNIREKLQESIEE